MRSHSNWFAVVALGGSLAISGCSKTSEKGLPTQEASHKSVKTLRVSAEPLTQRAIQRRIPLAGTLTA